LAGAAALGSSLAQAAVPTTKSPDNKKLDTSFIDVLLK